MAAIIEYMWIKIYEDEEGNEKFIPQFRIDGTQQFWLDSVDIQPTKLSICPISKQLADNMQANKIPGLSVPLPTYTFYLAEDDNVKAYWDGEIQTTSHFHCTTCETNWKHTDSSKWAKCPSCGESDVWHCSRCGTRNIDNLLVKKTSRGETNCPFCEEPHGLNRERRLERIQDVIENIDYVIEIEDRCKIIIRQHSVDIYSI